MTSRPQAVVQPSADPKQLAQIEAATAKMRVESEKLSKLQDLKAIEEKRRAAEKDLDQAQDLAADIRRRADEDAEGMLANTRQECKELLDKAAREIGAAKSVLEGERKALVAEQELLSIEKAELRHAQSSLAQAETHRTQEEKLLHGKMDELRRAQEAHRASVENHRTDLGSLTLRERKVSEMETRTIEGLKAVQERELLLAGKEDSAHRLKEDAARELSEASARSYEAQEKWNRAELREQACARREKQLEASEREYAEREQKLGAREHDLKRRENECVLREAQASVRPSIKT